MAINGYSHVVVAVVIAVSRVATSCHDREEEKVVGLGKIISFNGIPCHLHLPMIIPYGSQKSATGIPHGRSIVP